MPRKRALKVVWADSYRERGLSWRRTCLTCITYSNPCLALPEDFVLPTFFQPAWWQFLHVAHIFNSMLCLWGNVASMESPLWAFLKKKTTSIRFALDPCWREQIWGFKWTVIAQGNVLQIFMHWGTISFHIFKKQIGLDVALHILCFESATYTYYPFDPFLYKKIWARHKQITAEDTFLCVSSSKYFIVTTGFGYRDISDWWDISNLNIGKHLFI